MSVCVGYVKQGYCTVVSLVMLCCVVQMLSRNPAIVMHILGRVQYCIMLMYSVFKVHDLSVYRLYRGLVHYQTAVSLCSHVYYLCVLTLPLNKVDFTSHTYNVRHDKKF